jgi:hypothetical protein
MLAQAELRVLLDQTAEIGKMLGGLQRSLRSRR